MTSINTYYPSSETPSQGTCAMCLEDWDVKNCFSEPDQTHLEETWSSYLEKWSLKHWFDKRYQNRLMAHPGNGLLHSMHRLCLQPEALEAKRTSRLFRCPVCRIELNPKLLFSLPDKLVMELKLIRNDALVTAITVLAGRIIGEGILLGTEHLPVWSVVIDFGLLIYCHTIFEKAIAVALPASTEALQAVRIFSTLVNEILVPAHERGEAITEDLQRALTTSRARLNATQIRADATQIHAETLGKILNFVRIILPGVIVLPLLPLLLTKSETPLRTEATLTVVIFATTALMAAVQTKKAKILTVTAAMITAVATKVGIVTTIMLGVGGAMLAKMPGPEPLKVLAGLPLTILVAGTTNAGLDPTVSLFQSVTIIATIIAIYGILSRRGIL
jgi:hypothetical protein